MGLLDPGSQPILRPVSSHLYHAFPKLGVTSRAKLKAAIEGAGLVAVAP